MCWTQKTIYLKCNHTMKEGGCDGTRPWPSPNRCKYPRILKPTTVDSYCGNGCAPTQSSKRPVGILKNKEELPSYSQAVAGNDPPTHSQANEFQLAEERVDDELSRSR